MQFAIPTRLQFPDGLSKKQRKRLESWHSQFQKLVRVFLAAGVSAAWLTGQAADGDDLPAGRTLFLTVDVVDRRRPMQAIWVSMSTLQEAARREIGRPVQVLLHVGNEPPHGSFQVFLRPAVHSASNSAPPASAAVSASQ